MKRSRQNLLWIVPLLVLVAAFAQPRFTFGSEYRDDFVDAVGFALVLAGVSLRVCARGWKYERGSEGLVTDGLYGYVRHPLYAASFLIGLGICAIIGAPFFTLAYLLLFWASHLPVIRREEAKLARRWAQRHAAYRERVPALVPAPRRLRERSPIRPRGLLAAVRREADAACGWSLACAVLVVWQDLAAPAGPARLTPEVLALLLASAVLVVAWIALRVQGLDGGSAPAGA
jgi:protein-S-isoprenylcysteine O-methyltransferase Ste14